MNLTQNTDAEVQFGSISQASAFQHGENYPKWISLARRLLHGMSHIYWISLNTLYLAELRRT